MPRHDGSRYTRSRKQRKRRGRNRQSWLDRGKPGATVVPGRKT